MKSNFGFTLFSLVVTVLLNDVTALAQVRMPARKVIYKEAARACRNAKTGRPELYEYADQRGRIPNYALEQVLPNVDYLRQVEFLIRRLESLDQKGASLLREFVSDFPKAASFVRAQEFEKLELPASGKGGPVDCFEEPFAVEIFNPRPNEVRYIVNEDFWRQSDVSTQAGLVLHLAIYRASVETFKLESTEHTNYLNAVLGSVQFSQINSTDYQKLLGGSGFICRTDFVPHSRDPLSLDQRHRWCEPPNTYGHSGYFH